MSDGFRLDFQRADDDAEGSPLTPVQLQKMAEGAVSLQLSWLGGLRISEDEEMNGLDPDLVVELPGGKYLHIYVRGTETSGDLPAGESQWLEERRAHALKGGLVACFVEVFYSRQGKGYSIRWRGLGTVKRALAALKNGVTAYDWHRSGESEVLGDEDSPESQAEDWLQRALLISMGKTIDGIPEGNYCTEYELPLERSAEAEECIRRYGKQSEEFSLFWFEAVRPVCCPYQEWTEHGMVTCHHLEETAVGVSEESYEKALAHFGSDEALDEACTGSFLLGDGVRCCTTVVERVRAEPEQENSSS